jgi:hypothetical protein
MNEGARSTVATHCECPDCRQYRLWRAEGTDEWQPRRDGSNAPSVAIDVDAVDSTPTRESQPLESLSSL